MRGQHQQAASVSWTLTRQLVKRSPVTATGRCRGCFRRCCCCHGTRVSLLLLLELLLVLLSRHAHSCVVCPLSTVRHKVAVALRPAVAICT
jgi:hypothetical protein